MVGRGRPVDTSSKEAFRARITDALSGHATDQQGSGSTIVFKSASGGAAGMNPVR